MAILGLLACGVLFVALGIDYARAGSHSQSSGIRFINFSPEAVSNSIGVLSSIVAAVLGIVVTVVSIVVQLAATRYTAAVTDIFLRDTLNKLVIGFYIIGCIVGLWIAFAVQDGWVPTGSLFLMLLIATFCFLLMPPYFNHVFKLLSPKTIVNTLENRIDDILFANNSLSSIDKQHESLEQVETLCDIAINSIAQKDRIIAIATVDALASVATKYMNNRNDLEQEWYRTQSPIKKNPDFSSLAKDYIEQLDKNQTWFEFKLFRQYQTIYNEALGSMTIVNYEIAIQLRRIAEVAQSNNLNQVLTLAINFFNTCLRATINSNDIRTTYTILNQYRLLAEYLLKKQHNETVLLMANYMKYYSHIAHHKNLSFITETVAYDIGQLCELAFVTENSIETDLLSCFLEVDPRTVEGSTQESSLHGVRKAQVKMATFYLLHGRGASAKRIWADMKDEDPKRMRSIHTELMAVSTKEFWEISERGENFDFLNDNQKGTLNEFFSWFGF